MAAAFLNRIAERAGVPTRAYSAGLSPFGHGATKGAVNAAKRWNVDLSHHRPQPMTDALAADADIILTMTELHAAIVEAEFAAAEGKTFTLLEFIGNEGDVPDPFNRSSKVYRECAEQLWDAVGETLRRLDGAGTREPE
jgi:protein-tyrosine-phosphatase